MEPTTLAHISKYLSLDVINKVFKCKTKSEDVVQRLEITRAAPVGEGLISAVYRLKVTGKTHTESFIAKGLVQDDLIRNSLNSAKFFKREVVFFSKILPVLIETQKDLGAKECIQNYLPVCYACHTDGKDDYILLEDLSVREMKSVPSHPTKLERDIVLKLLAHFHSVSLALRVKKPDVFSDITNGLDEVFYTPDNREWFGKLLQSAITIDKNVVAEIEGTNGIYYNKFKQYLSGDVYGNLIETTSTRGDHPVINHGDAWLPNFFCGKESAVAFDFQIVRCVSPATDLSYFITLCSNLCVGKENYLEAISVYYSALEFYLTDMGIVASEVFSFETLKEELKRYGKFGLTAALTTIPLIASERIDILKPFDNIPEGELVPIEQIWRLMPISPEEDKNRLVNAVRIAVDAGFI